jgi:hypothetical protein
LPADLNEVSGLAALDERRVAMVQDELGELFVFDLRAGRIVERMKFGPKGDYEGLARVGEEFWVLRSDGLLLQLQHREGRLDVVARSSLVAAFTEYEGLDYDPTLELLLVAPKDRPKLPTRPKRSKQAGSPEAEPVEDRRPVLGFDPRTHRQTAEPVLSISIERVVAEAALRQLWMPSRTTRKGEERVRFDPRFSAIAVHPITKAIYLLSARERGLLVVDREGGLLDYQLLDSDLMPQPEGITFLPNGAMLIASEAAGRVPMLHLFRYREAPPSPGQAQPPSTPDREWPPSRPAPSLVLGLLLIGLLLLVAMVTVWVLLGRRTRA